MFAAYIILVMASFFLGVVAMVLFKVSMVIDACRSIVIAVKRLKASLHHR